MSPILRIRQRTYFLHTIANEGAPLIIGSDQANAVVESLHNRLGKSGRFNVFLTKLVNRAPITDANNSILGIVGLFNGASRDLAMSSCTDTVPSAPMARRYTTAA